MGEYNTTLFLLVKMDKFMEGFGGFKNDFVDKNGIVNISAWKLEPYVALVITWDDQSSYEKARESEIWSDLKTALGRIVLNIIHLFAKREVPLGYLEVKE